MSDKDVGVCGLCVWACSAKKDPVAYTAMMNVSEPPYELKIKTH